MFTTLAYVLIALSMVLCVLTVVFAYYKMQAARVISKTLASCCFLTLAVSTLFTAQSYVWSRYMLFALLFGVLGDVFLVISNVTDKKNENIFNAVGVLFFLLDHVLLICTFFVVTNRFNPWVLFIVLGVTVLFALLYKFKVVDCKKEFIPLLVYTAVIGLMLASAVNLYLANPESAFSSAAVVASVCFLVSDTLLVLYNFSKFKSILLMYVYMLLYYFAQLTFACSLLIY